jgi:hypothetical protein
MRHQTSTPTISIHFVTGDERIFLMQMKMLDPNAWINVVDAARHAGTSERKIYDLVKSGVLRAVLLGGKREIRLKAAWVDDCFEKLADSPPPPLVKRSRRRAETAAPPLEAA